VARHQRHVARHHGDELVRREEHVADRVVLPLLAVEDRADDELHRIDAGGDHRAEHAEGVEALAARPLLEAWVLPEEIDGGHVVHAGVAEDVVASLGLAHHRAFLADDDTELALIDDAAGIGFGPLDRRAMRMIGVGTLQEIKRLVGNEEVVLGGELMEIVPETDHLRGVAGCQHPDLGELHFLARRFGTGEHVARMDGDRAVLECSESDTAALLEPDPLRHSFLPVLADRPTGDPAACHGQTVPHRAPSGKSQPAIASARSRAASDPILAHGLKRTQDRSRSTAVSRRHARHSGGRKGRVVRIAQVAPLAEAVPPRLYGGTERVVSYLTEELVELGHDVTLFASGDSLTQAELVPMVPRALRLEATVRDPVALHIALVEAVSRRADEFDAIHVHFDHLHLPLFTWRRLPFLTTLHGRLDMPELVPVMRAYPDAPFVSISDAQRRPLPFVDWLATVHHGLPAGFPGRRPEPGGYLAFLGRICPEKGPDRAIRIAVRAGMPLKIAARSMPSTAPITR